MRISDWSSDVCSSDLLLPESKRRKTVQVRDIEETVARIARIPPKSVSSNDRDKLATLERDLKLVIYGQDNAIEQLTACIKLSRSGLGSPAKPIGNLDRKSTRLNSRH